MVQRSRPVLSFFVVCHLLSPLLGASLWMPAPTALGFPLLVPLALLFPLVTLLFPLLLFPFLVPLVLVLLFLLLVPLALVFPRNQILVLVVVVVCPCSQLPPNPLLLLRPLIPLFPLMLLVPLFPLMLLLPPVRLHHPPPLYLVRQVGLVLFLCLLCLLIGGVTVALYSF